MMTYLDCCHTGNHEYHIFIPWRWGVPYDKTCDICGYEAAAVFGDKPLCDCCAEDWDEWNTYDKRIDETKALKHIWPIVYAEFKKYALKEM